MDVQALETALGHQFQSKDLLQQALTHRSHSVAHNERLEFLGDSVLNCVVASLLFDMFARIDEGDLSRLRANLVKQQSLYEIAQRLELSPFLRLGEGELKSGGFRRPSILADTVEALFGAIFLDAGFDVARRAIRRLYLPVLETVDPKTLGKDSKTLLQEYLQGRKIALPIYTVVATHGAAHSQEFEVECAVPKLAIQVLGAGGSRRAAEQAAAKKALEAAQSLSVAAAKKTRRVKPAQLTLEVAVEQSAEPVANAGDGAARPTGGTTGRDHAIAERSAARVVEPARIVAPPSARAAVPEGGAAQRPEGRALERRVLRVGPRPDSRTDLRPGSAGETRAGEVVGMSAAPPSATVPEVRAETRAETRAEASPEARDEAGALAAAGQTTGDASESAGRDEIEPSARAHVA